MTREELAAKVSVVGTVLEDLQHMFKTGVGDMAMKDDVDAALKALDEINEEIARRWTDG